jgi:hypothetical protein
MGLHEVRPAIDGQEFHRSGRYVLSKIAQCQLATLFFAAMCTRMAKIRGIGYELHLFLSRTTPLSTPALAWMWIYTARKQSN